MIWHSSKFQAAEKQLAVLEAESSKELTENDKEWESTAVDTLRCVQQQVHEMQKLADAGDVNGLYFVVRFRLDLRFIFRCTRGATTVCLTA